jgi:hypothetical protein
LMLAAGKLINTLSQKVLLFPLRPPMGRPKRPDGVS